MGAMPLLRNETVSRSVPARMEQLAKLPVFWELDGRRVIVAGGSDAAAWKAELVAACGAAVHVYARDISETFAGLIRKGPAHPQGRFFHHDKAWEMSDMDGACLAIADCATEEEAAAFRDAGRTAGVPVNIIDKPAFCQFQFGSIVNRSPVVISISTDGAAPILAQAIRRRIEGILPPALKAWAMLAQDIRGRVNAQLEAGTPRRAFWERFVDRAFSGCVEDNAVARLLKDMTVDNEEHYSAGQITFVGAGSGDAELLTLKAIRALQAADVIFFDELVSDEILELARREASCIRVGSCNRNSSDMMIALARDGKSIVRLQLGDPAVFDRPSEVIMYLQRQGICVRTVAGIPAIHHSETQKTHFSFGSVV